MKVANISLFIYIGCRDYIQIVITSPDLVATRQDLVAMALAVSPIYQ